MGKNNLAVMLTDGNYYQFIFEAIKNAKHSIWIQIFIVDMRYQFDKDMKVRELLKLCSTQKKKGVDVKLIISSTTTSQIQVANLTTLEYATSLGVPTKIYSSTTNSSTHSKVVMIDNELSVVGSHNWSNSAFNMSIQDSIAIYSEEFATTLLKKLNATWKLSKVYKAEFFEVFKAGSSSKIFSDSYYNHKRNKHIKEFEISFCELISDRSYLKSLLELIETSQTSIEIFMFYFKFFDDKKITNYLGSPKKNKSSVQQIMDALINAKKGE